VRRPLCKVIQHAYDYDGLGRQIHDRVPTLGTSAVGSSRRLSTVYDTRGMVSTVTTWDNPLVGFGNILNQVQNTYNDFGQQTHSYQAHGGSVNTSTTPKVQYSYANGSANTIRMTGMTYPSNRVLTYGYGTANGINDACSRIESVSDSANLATYQYLGASGFVNAASAEPGINWTLIGTGNDPNTGDIYWGLDRFGRVDNCLWKQSTTTLAQIQYGYDRASNRTWRMDGVLTGYDELYAYDGLYRLTDQKRGTLNGTQTAITTGTFEQQWGLDPTGNWKTFKQDNDGNGTWELNQTRTANKVNEITGITNSVGTAWATPTYDGAGNMIGMPNPPATITGTTPAWVPMTEAQWNTLTEAQWNTFTENTGTTPQALSAQYDAWNRLVLITNGTQKVMENVYDARSYRIRKDTYTSGTLTEARHYYYTPGWQCVEERVDASTTAERQFVWGLRYIDDLILRDRSTANNGTMNERRYAMQDGNWNTIAICDNTGSVTERYAYSAYGSPVFMTGAGVVQSASAIGFETLYAGYRFDGTAPQMYYVRNRFLLPMIGTWNRRDPLGYVDGINSLQYIQGSPLTAIDATGTIAQQPCHIRILAAHNFEVQNYLNNTYPGESGDDFDWTFPEGDLVSPHCCGLQQKGTESVSYCSFLKEKHPCNLLEEISTQQKNAVNPRNGMLYNFYCASMLHSLTEAKQAAKKLTLGKLLDKACPTNCGEVIIDVLCGKDLRRFFETTSMKEIEELLEQEGATESEAQAQAKKIAVRRQSCSKLCGTRIVVRNGQIISESNGKPNKPHPIENLLPIGGE
jgi:RHS repeat-associated protein